MSARLTRFPLLAAPLLALALASCTDPAGPDAPGAALRAPARPITACGTTIREPGTYILTTDLLGCPGTGIEVAANGVTLRLEGHTLAGTGIGTSLGSGISMGPALYEGVRDVRVEGPGTVRDFRYGIVTEHLERGLIRGITVARNEQGLTLNRRFAGDGLPTTDIQVLDNLVRDNWYHGITLNGGAHFVIRGNRLAGNGAGPANGVALFLYDATGILVAGNTIVENHQGGIAILRGQLGHTVVENTVLRNGPPDLQDDNCRGNTWLRNRYGTAWWAACPPPR